MYTLNIEQQNIQQNKIETEKKGELIRCKRCNNYWSKTNISRLDDDDDDDDEDGN